ncbi:inner membrane peptidase complex catalytic subunit 2 [Schizosaccharomyces octosporus yFS286]|uniref:Mitochondrial inner membrane protease subunit n=1 Tax=Schizosaccharomyces octosporus (strain yFS286) TaxID=483514 RepID=S9PP74_SCHOY|nr:inner membrane peptidase complex catalytic subunit 2 [Schizosaccharomyces octosporus yFS286]EPX71026.1 inner membrane peptidase complex catalytic subunit 2 [Schizosaccharomyces octosporus yFS286]
MPKFQPNKKQFILTFARNFLGISLWIPAFLFIEQHIFSIGSIDGRSMKPTLNPETNFLKRDKVLVWKWNKSFERGDVVILRSPEDPQKLLVKRILAVEDDLVKTRPPKSTRFVPIPEGHVWVEGDEQFHSIDSNKFGPVSTGLITAKIIAVVFPFSRMRRIGNDDMRKDALVIKTDFD